MKGVMVYLPWLFSWLLLQNHRQMKSSENNNHIITFNDIEDICLFRWKIEKLFHSWTPEEIFSLVAKQRVKNIRSGDHEWSNFRSFTETNNFLFILCFSVVLFVNKRATMALCHSLNWLKAVLVILVDKHPRIIPIKF